MKIQQTLDCSTLIRIVLSFMVLKSRPFPFWGQIQVFRFYHPALGSSVRFQALHNVQEHRLSALISSDSVFAQRIRLVASGRLKAISFQISYRELLGRKNDHATIPKKYISNY